jgi:tetratricopeptide (TPR) repeat protein
VTTTDLRPTDLHPDQPPAARRGRRRVALALVGAVAVAGLVGAGSLLRPPTAPAVSAQAPSGPTTTVEGLAAYLEEVPADWQAWSGLGALQLERARSTGSPEWYGRAEQSFRTSLQIHPDDNPPALAGMAAVDAAKHDFAAAEAGARAALAVNPLDATAQAILVDSLTELGRYDEALAAAERLDSTHPGLSSYTRLAYQEELRGRVAQALSLLGRAADDAATPSQAAFARYQEGILALQSGDVARAQRSYAAGAAVAPDDLTLLHLRARIAAAEGRDDLAADLYRTLVQRRPTAAFAVEAAGVLSRTGGAQEASDLVALAQAQLRVSRANGVEPEPSDIVLEAEYGDPATALQMAEDLWSRQQGVYAADAYAVALHAVGRHSEALAYADRALALGTTTPSLREHRDQIRAALAGGSR